MGWGYDSPISGQDPVGNDVMVAAPTGMELRTEIEMVQQSANTFTDKDIELLKSRVESVVKQMMAEGRSDAEIQQAVAGMATSPELAGIAKEAAQQQLDADKFNMFSTRNDEQAQDQGMQFLGNVMSGIIGGAVAANSQDMSLGQGVTGGETVSPALLCTLATPNVPDCRAPSLDRGFGLS